MEGSNSAIATNIATRQVERSPQRSDNDKKFIVINDTLIAMNFERGNRRRKGKRIWEHHREKTNTTYILNENASSFVPISSGTMVVCEIGRELFNDSKKGRGILVTGLRAGVR